MIDFDRMKNCPFCGGAAKLQVARKGNWRNVCVKCRQCNARSGVIIAQGVGHVEKEEHEAIDMWNKRVCNCFAPDQSVGEG